MPTYSHSQLSTYETCPHQYKLAYIDKIEVETESIEAFMGSRVHDTLEKLYRDLRVTKLISLEDLLDFYHQNWEKNWTNMVLVIRKEYRVEDYKRLGEKCIADYYERYHPFSHGVTLGLEEYIMFPLDGEKDYSIRGYIDRLTLVDQSILEIHDYKTSRKLPPQREIDSDRQLAFYQIGVEGKWPGIQEVRLVWHYLSFDAELRSSRTPEQLHKVRREAIDLIRKIEADRHFLPRETPLCGWCDYQAFCPKRRHLVATESLPPNEYLMEEGISLLNQYIELVEKKKEMNEAIDAELSKIEEALYAYARKEGVEAIFGSDHVARIRIEMKEKYPLKGDPRRKVLDDLIKRAGKWMEVSDLNPWMLARVLGQGDWPLALAKRVREFCAKTESRSVSLSKLKERE
jgi:putative RecB family exonuclease